MARGDTLGDTLYDNGASEVPPMVVSAPDASSIEAYIHAGADAFSQIYNTVNPSAVPVAPLVYQTVGPSGTPTVGIDSSLILLAGLAVLVYLILRK